MVRHGQPPCGCCETACLPPRTSAGQESDTAHLRGFFMRVTSGQGPFFAQIPFALLDDPATDAETIATYCALRRFTDFGSEKGCFASHSRLAAVAGTSIATLKRRLEWLRSAGWIGWEGALGRSNRYAVNQTQVRVSEGVAQGERGTQVRVTHPLAQGEPLPRDSNRETKDTKKHIPSTALALKRDDIVAELQSLFHTQHVNGGLREAKAKLLFAYWAAKWDHPHAIYDGGRQGTLKARLRENGDDVSELLWVVDGAKRDDWKDRGRYAGIEHLFRDRATVERLAQLAPGYQRDEYHPMAAKFCPKENGHAVG